MSGCSGWQAVNPLCRAGQALGGAAKSASNDFFGSIADYFAGVADSALNWLWSQLNNATSVDLTSTGIQTDLIATGAIAALITFGLFIMQVISAVIRQEPGALGRGVRGLAVSFIGAAFAIGATQLLLAAVDALCDGVVRFALGTNVEGLGSKLVVSSTLAAIGNPAGLFLLSLVIIAAVVVVWVALMIRKMLIIVSAVFAPIAFSGAASDATRSWVRKWIEFTVALIFSKLILVIIFMIGLSVLDGAGTSPGSDSSTSAKITSLVIGVLTLLLAGLAPWLAIKMVHFAGDSFHGVHAQAAAATSGGRSVVAAPQKVAMAAGKASTISGTAATLAARSSTSKTAQQKSSAGGNNVAQFVGTSAGAAPTSNGGNRAVNGGKNARSTTQPSSGRGDDR